MNIEELRIELEKRDLNQYIGKRKPRPFEIDKEYNGMTKVIYKERLVVYLMNDECKKVYNMIVKGYCRKIQQKGNV